MAKLIILFILIIALFAGYAAHLFWKRTIDPKRSGGHFLLYMVVHLLSVFVIVFIISFIMFRFGNFLFKG